MEIKLLRSKRQSSSSSSGNGSAKVNIKLNRPASSSSSTHNANKNSDPDRLRRRNHDHNLSQKFIKSSDPRIQPGALISGHRKYAHTFPPRGTLDDVKLDYLTWRMHLLFAQQTRTDDESGVLLEQDNVSGGEEINKQSAQRPASSSTCSADSLQSAVTSCQQAEGGGGGGVRAAVMMDRGQSEPGWIDLNGVEVMNEMMTEAKHALKQALIADNALAAVPLLEREDRLFAVTTTTNNIKEEKQNRHRICDEAHSGDSSSIEEIVPVDDTLPPPLMPASMFYRASFGLRTKPSRSTSSQSIPKSVQSAQNQILPSSPSSKLRSIFRIHPRRTRSEEPNALYTLGSVPS